MAESSRFWTTNGTGDGGAGGYSAQQFYDFLRKLFITDQEASRGVILGEQGGLAVSGSASPLSVAAGSAIVYGFFYENTGVVSVTVPTPSVGTTGKRVILRVNWAAQTVRIALITSADGVATFPTLTQNAGNTWEISLANLTITTGGAITLTDARAYMELGSKVIADGVETASLVDNVVTDAKLRDAAAVSVMGRAAITSGDPADIVAGSNDLVLARASNALAFQQINTNMIADLAVTGGKIADDAVTNVKLRNSFGLSVIGRAVDSVGDPGDIQAGSDNYVLGKFSGILQFGQVPTGGIADDAITNAKIGALAVGSGEIAANAVIAGKLGDGAVDTTARLANDIIDDTKISNRVPVLRQRRGNNANDWITPGTTDYTVGDVRITCGTAVWSGTATSGTLQINFPTAYPTNKNPVGFVQIMGDQNNQDIHCAVVCDESYIYINWFSHSTQYSFNFMWLAIGSDT